MIRREHAADFHDAMSANAKASVACEPGCRHFDVCIDPADPTRFFLYELYDDEAAVRAHLASNHFAEMSRLTADWVEHKSVRRLVLCEVTNSALPSRHCSDPAIASLQRRLSLVSILVSPPEFTRTPQTDASKSVRCDPSLSNYQARPRRVGGNRGEQKLWSGRRQVEPKSLQPFLDAWLREDMRHSLRQATCNLAWQSGRSEYRGP